LNFGSRKCARSDCRFWVVACEDTPRLLVKCRKRTRIRSGAQRRTAGEWLPLVVAPPAWAGMPSFARLATRSPADKVGQANRPPLDEARVRIFRIDTPTGESEGVLAGDDPEATIGSHPASRSRIQHGTNASLEPRLRAEARSRRGPPPTHRHGCHGSSRLKPQVCGRVCLTHPLEPSKFNGLAYTGDDVATKGGSRICRK
jgi:hypothetical protein